MAAFGPTSRSGSFAIDDDIYVRSAAGPDNPWFRRALASADGRIRAGGIEQDVACEVPAPQVAARITAAYHAKYDRYGSSIVGTVVSARAVDPAAGATSRLAEVRLGVVGTAEPLPFPTVVERDTVDPRCYLSVYLATRATAAAGDSLFCGRWPGRAPKNAEEPAIPDRLLGTC